MAEAKRITEPVVLTATVGESTEDAGHIVQIDERRMKRIQDADPDKHPAKFVTVEVESGMSGNKRNWPPHVLDSIAQQVMEKQPVGYRGHPLLRKDFDKGSDYPPPQTLWLSAITTVSDKGKKLLAKGYNITQEIRRELASGATRTVSICGDATMRVVKGGYDVEEFDLQTIDWARPGSQGMQASIVALTGEQTEVDEITDEDEMEDDLVKPEQLADLTEGDLRRHNPELVKQIEDVGAERKSDELKETVGEQEAAVTAAQPAIDAVAEIRKMLNLDEKADLASAVGDLLSKAKGALKVEFDKAVDKVLSKIEDTNVRDLVKQLVGEMDASTVETEEEAYKQGEEKVAEILDKNETVKKLVGEMVDGEDDDTGTKRTRVVSPSHKPESDREKKDGKKDNDNLAHETISVG